MTVNELLGIMGQYHNDGKTGLEVRVFVTDESAEDAGEKVGLDIKRVWLDSEAYPKPEIVIEV